ADHSHGAVDCRWRLCAARRRSGIPALAATRRAHLEQPHPIRPIRILGHLVAVRAVKHDLRWASLVRTALPRGRAVRSNEPAWPGPPHAALDQLERLAVRGLCLHHSLWTVRQRLSVS